VAASSAFPPFLSPMRLDLSKYPLERWPGDDDRTQVRTPVPAAARSRAVLTDGGVYDNHGLEPVDEWPTLLVSDGGAPHVVGTGSYWNWISQMTRVLAVTDNQVRSLRRRHLIGRFRNHRAFLDLGMTADQAIVRSNACEGAYWSIGTDPGLYGDVGGLDCPPEAVTGLAAVATGMSDVGDATRSALVNWGYAICDKAVRGWYRPDLPAATKWPMPGGLDGAPRPTAS
jgi:NTE family protein